VNCFSPDLLNISRGDLWPLTPQGRDGTGRGLLGAGSDLGKELNVLTNKEKTGSFLGLELGFSG